MIAWLEPAKFLLFMVTSSIYAWIVLVKRPQEDVGLGEIAPAYILIAATAGCVSLIPSRDRFLTVAPLVTSATGAYLGASYFGTDISPASVGRATVSARKNYER